MAKKRYHLGTDGIWHRTGWPDVTTTQPTPVKPIQGLSLFANPSVAQVGAVNAHRVFDNSHDSTHPNGNHLNYPTHWSDSAGSNDPDTCTSYWSLKPEIPRCLAGTDNTVLGTDDAWFRTFLGSIPSTHNVVVIFEHEPESQINGGQYTQAQWQTLQIRMGNVVHSIGNPRLRTATVIQGKWTFDSTSAKKGTGFYNDRFGYWTSGFAGLIDIQLFDPYSASLTKYTNFATDPPTLSCIQWMQSHNTPIGWAEYAASLGTGDPTGSGRAAWLNKQYQFGKDAGLYVQLYWNSTATGKPYSMLDDATIQAYKTNNADSKV